MIIARGISALVHRRFLILTIPGAGAVARGYAPGYRAQESIHRAREIDIRARDASVR